MRSRRSKVLAAGLLAAAALGAAGPAQTALAYISPPLVLLASTQGTGTLVAKGAAVDVPISYTCAGPPSMEIFVQVTEAVGRRTATGSVYTSVPCTGRNTNTTVRVPAQSGGASFGNGTASVRLDVYGGFCTSRNCYFGNDTFNSTIKIGK